MFIQFEKYPFKIVSVEFPDKCNENDNEYQRIIFDTDGDVKIQMDAIGDCCSTSVFVQWESHDFKNIIGKTIKTMNEIEVPSDYEVEEDVSGDYYASPHLYEFIFTDDSVFKFLMINYSNGYYDGWIEFTILKKS